MRDRMLERHEGCGRFPGRRRPLTVVLVSGLAALPCTGEPGQEADSGTPDTPEATAPGLADTATWTIAVTSAPPDVGAPPLPVLTLADPWRIMVDVER